MMQIHTAKSVVPFNKGTNAQFYMAVPSLGSTPQYLEGLEPGVEMKSLRHTRKYVAFRTSFGPDP